MNDMSSAAEIRFGASSVDMAVLPPNVYSATAWNDNAPLPKSAGEQSNLPYHFAGAFPAPARHTAQRALQLRLKRVFDICVTLLAMLFLAPMLIFVAILVKLTSKGPVLFRQSREGLNGKPFMAYKFRSMKIEATDTTGVKQTVKNDPRVTPIGRFLRRSSIDELPQLLNVLLGDMSLVGPRPHVAGMLAGGRAYKELVPYYNQRLEMVPGITGWAQANGLRGPTDQVDKAVARIDHDIAYIQNFSFWLDIKIIFLTLKNEIIGGSGH